MKSILYLLLLIGPLHLEARLHEPALGVSTSLCEQSVTPSASALYALGTESQEILQGLRKKYTQLAAELDTLTINEHELEQSAQFAKNALITLKEIRVASITASQQEFSHHCEKLGKDLAKKILKKTLTILEVLIEQVFRPDLTKEKLGALRKISWTLQDIYMTILAQDMTSSQREIDADLRELLLQARDKNSETIKTLNNQ